jgi:guanylate kinase
VVLLIFWSISKNQIIWPIGGPHNYFFLKACAAICRREPWGPDINGIKKGKRRGQLFVIAAPSGAGKTSLVKALMAQRPALQFSVSYTTRAPRPAERPGVDYHFVSVEVFRAMAAAGEFLEHAQVFDHYYGTAQATLETALAQGRDLLLEIDWQGAAQVRKRLPEARGIFILPPSRAALEERLRKRRTDSDEVIARRLRDSVTELSHWSEFDFVVVIDHFDRALTYLQ